MCLPVIATNWSGMTEFMDQDVAFPLGYSLQPIGEWKTLLLGLRHAAPAWGKHACSFVLVKNQSFSRWLEWWHSDESSPISTADADKELTDGWFLGGNWAVPDVDQVGRRLGLLLGGRSSGNFADLSHLVPSHHAILRLLVLPLCS